MSQYSYGEMGGRHLRNPKIMNQPAWFVNKKTTGEIAAKKAKFVDQDQGYLHPQSSRYTTWHKCV